MFNRTSRNDFIRKGSTFDSTNFSSVFYHYKLSKQEIPNYYNKDECDLTAPCNMSLNVLVCDFKTKVYLLYSVKNGGKILNCYKYSKHKTRISDLENYLYL